MSSLRQTHTFATLEVAGSTYDEIREKLKSAGYEHAFVDGAIDMHGIGLVREGDETREQSRQEPILQFFRYAHLPERLAAVSKPFGDMAHDIVTRLPRNPERTVALRKLLEAKDAAVRAALYITPAA
jgi:hypothetical protein